MRRSLPTRITYRDQQTLVTDDHAMGTFSILIREAYGEEKRATFIVTLVLPEPDSDLDISMPNAHLVGETK